MRRAWAEFIRRDVPPREYFRDILAGLGFGGLALLNADVSPWWLTALCLVPATFFLTSGLVPWVRELATPPDVIHDERDEFKPRPRVD